MNETTGFLEWENREEHSFHLIENYKKLAKIAFRNMAYEEAVSNYIILEDLDSDKREYYEILAHMANMYKMPFVLDLDFLYAKIEEFEETEDYLGLGYVYLTLGIAYRMRRRYERSLHNTIKAISCLKKLSKNPFLFLAYLQLAEIYVLQEEPYLALQRLELAREKSLIEKNIYWQYRTTLYMGYVYGTLEQNENAIEALEIVERLPFEIEETPLKVHILYYKASIYHMLMENETALRLMDQMKESVLLQTDIEMIFRIRELRAEILREEGNLEASNNAYREMTKDFFRYFEKKELYELKGIHQRRERQKDLEENTYEREQDERKKEALKEKNKDFFVLRRRMLELIEALEFQLPDIKEQLEVLIQFKEFLQNEDHGLLKKIKKDLLFFDQDNALESKKPEKETILDMKELLKNMKHLLVVLDEWGKYNL